MEPHIRVELMSYAYEAYALTVELVRHVSKKTTYIITYKWSELSKEDGVGFEPTERCCVQRYSKPSH